MEWHSVRELVKTRDPANVMLVQVAPSEMTGFLSIDGYVDAQHLSPHEIAEFIFERLSLPDPFYIEIRLSGSLLDFTI